MGGVEPDCAQRDDVAGSNRARSDTDKHFEAVYDELRSLAAAWFRGQRAGHTLQPTALVHEAFLRLADTAGRESGGREYEDQSHLLATVARAMRQILVDHARATNALKRGGGCTRVGFEQAEIGDPVDDTPVDVELLHGALQRLEGLNRRQAEIVELRFFGGLTIEEVAKVLSVSPRTVKLDWQFARAWLSAELKGSEPVESRDAR